MSYFIPRICSLATLSLRDFISCNISALTRGNIRGWSCTMIYDMENKVRGIINSLSKYVSVAKIQINKTGKCFINGILPQGAKDVKFYY